MPVSAASVLDRTPDLKADEDRVYTDAEADFLRECVRYRAAHGRRFLDATDYLKILLALGYRKEA